MPSEAQIAKAAAIMMQHGLNAPEQVIYAAARAALAAAEVKPRVKPLVWEPQEGEHHCARAFDLFWVVIASKSTPLFWIARSPSEQLKNHLGGFKFDTVEDAKAAAQQDYASRILSALTTEGE